MNLYKKQQLSVILDRLQGWERGLQRMLDTPTEQGTNDSRPRKPWLRRTAALMSLIFGLQSTLVVLPASAQALKAGIPVPASAPVPAKASPTPAAVVAAPNAPIGQTPLIDATANGVTLVHVAPPTAGGVSVNRYNQFNGPSNGLILNNSTTATSTQLGGTITRNLQYGTQAATIILNEVVSTNPSSLKGVIEVAGQKADIVIANPNGISCDGCGFLNTLGRTVLTTGTPQLSANGSLQGFNVSQGAINIGAGGLNAANQEQLDLLARGLIIQGQVVAQNLNALAGANQVLYGTLGAAPKYASQAGTGPAPTFAIDIKNLGGMYANQIFLVATDKGLGVNSTGRVAALQGNLVLSANGDLTLKDTNASGNVSIASTASHGQIELTGQTAAGDSLLIHADQQISNSGQMQAKNALALNSANLQNSGLISLLSSSNDLVLSPVQSLQNTGQIYGGHDVRIATQVMSTAAPPLTGEGLVEVPAKNTGSSWGGSIVAHNDLNINAGRINTGQQQWAAGHNINVQAADIQHTNGAVVAGNNVSLNSPGRLNLNGTQLAAQGGVQLQAAQISAQGAQIQSVGQLAVQAAQSLNLQNAGLASNTGVLLSGASVDARGSQLSTLGNLSAQSTAGTLAADGAQWAVQNAASLQGQGVSLAGAKVSANTLAVDAGSQSLNNQGGQLLAGSKGDPALSIQALGGVNNAGGTILSSGTTSLSLGAGTLNNQQGRVAGDTVTVQSGDVASQSGQLQAAQNLKLNSSGAVDISAGVMSAGNDLNVKAASLTATGNGAAATLVSGGDTNLTFSGAAQLSNVTLVGKGNVSIQAASADLAGEVVAGKNYEVRTVGALNQNGTLLVGQQANLQSGGDLNLGANVQSGSLQATSGGQLQVGGNLNVMGNTALTAGGDLNINGHIQSGNLTGSSGGQTSVSGTIATAGDTSLSATGNLNVSGAIHAGNNASLQSGGSLTVAQGGLVSAGGAASLSAAQDVNVQGSVGAQVVSASAGNNISISGQVSGSSTVALSAVQAINVSGQVSTSNLLANSRTFHLAGPLSSSGSVSINATQALDIGGDVNVGGNLALTTGGALSLPGAVQSGGSAKLISGGDLTLVNGITAAGVSLGSAANTRVSAINSSAGVNLAAGQALNVAGPIQAGGDVIAQSQGAMQLNGAVQSAGQISLGSQSTVTTQAALSSAGNLQIYGTQANLGGALSSQGNISLTTTQGLNASGAIQAAGAVLAAAQSGTVHLAGPVSSGSSTQVLSGQGIQLGGPVTAGTQLVAQAGGGVQAQQSLQAGSLNISGQQIQLTGPVNVGGAATVAGTSVSAVQAIQAGGPVSITGSGGAVQLQSTVASNSNLSIAASGPITLTDATARGNLVLNSQTASIQASTVAAGQALHAQAQTQLNATSVSAGGSATLTASTGALTVQQGVVAGGDVLAQSGLGLSVGGNLNGAGQVQASAQGGVLSVGGSVNSGGNQSLTGQAVQIAGNSVSGGTTTLGATAPAGAVTLGGSVNAAGNTAISGASIQLDGIQAQGGLQMLATHGDIRSTSSVSAQQAMTAQSQGQISVQGDLTSQSSISTQSGGSTLVQGQLLAGGALSAQAQGALHATNIQSGADTLLSAGADIQAQKIISTGQLQATAGTDIASAGNVMGSQVKLQATAGQISVGGQLSTPGAATLSAGGNVTAVGALTAGSAAGAATTIQSGGNIALQSVNAGGSYEAQAAGNHQVVQDLVAAGPLNIAAGGSVSGGGALTSGQNLNVESGGSIHQQGAVAAAGKAQLSSVGSTTLGSTLSAGSDLSATAGLGLQVASNVASGGNATLAGGQGAVQLGGSLQSQGQLDVSATGNIAVANSGQAQGASFSSSAGRVSLATSGQAGNVIQTAQNLSVQSATDTLFGAASTVQGNLQTQSTQGSITFAGPLNVAGNFTADARDNLTFQSDSTLVGATNMQARTGTLLNLGSMVLGQALTISQGGDFDNEGRIQSPGAISIGARSITSNANTGGGITTQKSLALDATGNVAVGQAGTLSSSGDMSLAGVQLTNAGQVQAGANLNVSASNFSNSGQVAAQVIGIASNLVNTGTVYGSQLSVGGATSNSGSLGASGAVALSTVNNSGTISGASISAVDTTNSGSVAATGSLVISGGTVNNVGSLSAADMTLQGSQAISNSGQIVASGQLTMSGASLVNAGSETATCPANASGPGVDCSNASQVTWTSSPSVLKAASISGNFDTITNSGQIAASGHVTLNASGAFVNQRVVNAPASMTAAQKDAGGGSSAQIQSGGTLTVAGSSVTNQDAQLIGNNVTVNSTGSFTNAGAQGALSAKNALNVNAQGAVTNGSGAQLLGTNQINVAATSLTNSGTVYGTNSAININTSGGVNNSGGTLIGGQSVNVSSSGFGVSGGTVGSLGDMTVTASGVVDPTIYNPLQVKGKLNIQADGLSVAAGETWSSGAAAVQWNGTLTNAGTVALAGVGIGDVVNNYTGSTTKSGTPPSDGTYLIVSRPTDLISPQIVSYTDVGQRAVFVAGGLQGSMVNNASNTSVAGSSYQPINVGQTITWQGYTVDPNDSNNLILDTRTTAGKSMAFLLAGSGSGPVNLVGPETGTIVGTNVVINGSDIRFVNGTGAQSSVNQAQTQGVSTALGGQVDAIAQRPGVTVDVQSVQNASGPMVLDAKPLALGPIKPSVVTIMDRLPVASAAADLSQNSVLLASGSSNIAQLSGLGASLAQASTAPPAGMSGLSLNPGAGNFIAASPSLSNLSALASLNAASLLTGTSLAQQIPNWSSLAVVPGGISAQNLNLNLTGTLQNASGALNVNNNLSINAGTIDNTGATLAAGGQVQLLSNGFDNKDGAILAGSLLAQINGNLNTTNGRIVSAGDATVLVKNNVQADGATLSGGNFTLAANGDIQVANASLSATQGNLVLSSTNGDLDTTSTQLNAQQGNARVYAGGQLTMGSLNAQSATLGAGGDLVNNGNLSVNGDLSLAAGKNLINNNGADLTSTDGSVSLAAGGNIELNAKTQSSSSTQTTKTAVQTMVYACDGNQDGGGSNCSDRLQNTGSTTTTTTSNSTQVQGSTISGRSVTLSAGGDIKGTAVQINATQGDATLVAGGNVALSSGLNSSSTSTNTSTESLATLVKPSEGGGDAYQVTAYDKSRTSSQTQSLAQSSVTASGNVQIQAGNQVNLTAVKVSGASATVSGAGGVNLNAMAVTNSQSTEADQTQYQTYDARYAQVGKGLSKASTVQAGTTITATQGDAQVSAKSADLVMAGSDVAAAQGNVILSGQNVTVQTAQGSTSNSQKSGQNPFFNTSNSDQATTQTGANLHAGKNLIIAATGQTAGSGQLNLTGAQVTADQGSVTLMGQDVNIRSNVTTDIKSASSVLFSSTSQSASNTQALNQSNITAGQDITVVASKPRAGAPNASTANGSPAASDNQNVPAKSSADTSASASTNVVSVDARPLASSPGTDAGSGKAAQGSSGSDANSGNVGIAGANLNAGRQLAIQADGNVNIGAVALASNSTSRSASSSSGWLSSSSTVTTTASQSLTNQGSTLGGHTVLVNAGQDLSVTGSGIGADGNLSLHAGGDVNISAATDSAGMQTKTETHKSGLFSGGGLGFTIGSQSSLTQEQIDALPQSKSMSTVGSLYGSVDITAGKALTVEGANITTVPAAAVADPAGYAQAQAQAVTADPTLANNPRSISLAGQSVTINPGVDKLTDQVQTHFEQSGLSVSISNPIVGAAQTVTTLAQQASASGNARMQALAGGAAALTVYNANKVVTAGQGNADGQIKGADGTMRDATTADKLGGLTINASLGSSRSDTSSTSQSTTRFGSSLNSAGDVNITATGAGQNSNINLVGTQVSSGGNVKLTADNQINLTAANSTSSLQTSNSSSGSSVGVSYSTVSGWGVSASTSQSHGSGNGQDSSYQNTTINAAQQVSLNSGGDTKLQGATVSGNSVQANVGGNLTIASVQDTSTYQGHQSSSGGSISVGLSVPSIGGGISAGNASANTNYQSVTQQSGIQAGDGGFQVKVNGNTTLTGGVIASTQAAVDSGVNRFDSGSLTLNDLQNTSSSQASASSVSLGYATGLQSSANPNLNAGKPNASLGYDSSSSSASSTARSGISAMAGNTAVRTGDSANALAKPENGAQLMGQVQAGAAITATFGQVATTAVGNYADSQMKSPDNTPEQQACWAEGGACRTGLHAMVGGLTGGVQGALGAGVSQAVIPQIGDLIAKTDLPDSVKQSLIATAGTLIGAGVGGAAGAAAAGNATVNNYLNHTDVSKLAEQLKQCGSDQKCRADAMNQAYASSAANDIALLNCKGAGTCDAQQAAYRQGYSGIQDLLDAGLSPNDVSAMLNMESNAQTIIRNGLYNNQCSSDQCVSNAKFLTGLGTGLANLTPAGMVAGTGVVAYQLTTSIINSGATETATAVARGLTGLPAELMAGLNSADPQVRGEALVNALAIGWVATAVGTKLGLTVLDNIGTGPVSGSLGAQRGGVKIPGAGGAAQEGGVAGTGANGGGKVAGEIKILQGATPDANELRAGQGLAEQFGYDVAHQPTASQLGVQGQRTADLTVKGVGQVDVYTPTSTNPTSITRAIEGKNTQATAVLVQTSIADADMATVAARTWGKPTAQNIQTIFFQKPDGSIVRFNRPTGG